MLAENLPLINIASHPALHPDRHHAVVAVTRPDFALSADGTRAAFIAPVPEEGRYGTTDDVPAPQEDPRLITAFQFQLNGTGYTADQRTQVFVVDLPDPGSEPPVPRVARVAKGGGAFRGVPEARQLSDGDFDHHCPAWDGDAVLAIAARHKDWDADLREDLYRFALDGSAPVRLTDSCCGDSADASPVVVGRWIFFVGFQCGLDGRSFFAESPGVYVVSREGATSAGSPGPRVCT